MDFCAAILSQICLTFTGQFLIYTLIALAMLIEGEIFLLVAGSLVHLGLLDFWWLALAAILGTWTSDLVWYELGRRYGEKIVNCCGKWFLLTPERFLKIKEIISRRGIWLVLVSKFSYGLNHAFMMAAGTVRFSFRRFLKYQLVVSALWVFIFISLGRFFASGLATIEKDVRFVGLTMLGVVVVFWLIERFVIRGFFKRFIGNGR